MAIKTINPIKKYRILSEIIKKVIAICIYYDCNKIFTGAKYPADIVYNKLAGFVKASEPFAYPPADKDIFLLALDFKKEYNERKRGVFNLPEDYIDNTRKEIEKL